MMNTLHKCLALCGCGLLLSASVCAQSWKKIHANAILVDTHNDVLSSATMKGMDISQHLDGKTHSDLPRFRQGGVDVQVFSIFCDERFGKDTAFTFANIEIDSLYAIAARNTDKMAIVSTPAELKRALRQKKMAAMIGVEGGHMIEDQLSYLDSLYRRGARYLTLTWNNSTSWASSAKDESRDSVRAPQKGLNDFGRQVVRRMNELGMMVDLSHVGEQTFWDAINTSTKPVIASHSCAYTLCPVFRNLKDEQIKAVAKNDGVIHVNFYSGFLDSTYNRQQQHFTEAHRSEVDALRKAGNSFYEIQDILYSKYPDEVQQMRAPMSLLIDHIDYIVRLAGIDHVGLGSDFDGIESPPRELNGVADYPLLTKALLERGYSKKDVRKILGGNFIRVFKANSKK
ncbi:dipeptidase [uncultured Chitinophaga sp.]|jgi:Zn-dependent dipeptidase, microsomal dipeptidase homolog|uniref:dipeptidase n=1 Tax=uncultured Chitinophaga sp. TaxID=339340 RepID=UPI0026125B1A|nr:dipeptidase [uncultured Chitinophaga sp.]